MFIMNVYLFKSEQRCLRSVAAALVLVFLFPRAVLTEVPPHFARSSIPAPLFSPTQQRGLLVMFQSSEGRKFTFNSCFILLRPFSCFFGESWWYKSTSGVLTWNEGALCLCFLGESWSWNLIFFFPSPILSSKRPKVNCFLNSSYFLSLV